MSRRTRRIACLFLPVVLIALTGCPRPNDPPIVDDDPIPTRDRTTDEVLGVIRANEAKLNRALWSSSVQVVARFTDAKGKEHPYNLEGSLLFQKPRNLLINLRPGIGENAMQVGSNDTEYWAWIEPEIETMWWGRHANVGKPCTEDVLVNPSELVAAMGIGLPSPKSGLFGPFHRPGKQSDLLLYGRSTGEEQRMSQEYRVMRVPPHLIDVIIFYDENGAKAMTATLGEFREVWDGGPLIAHEIHVEWPAEKNSLSIKIKKFQDFDENKIKVNAFARPNDSPPLPSDVYANMIQVDADCDGAAPRRRSVEPTGWNDDGTPIFDPPAVESPDEPPAYDGFDAWRDEVDGESPVRDEPRTSSTPEAP